jgi:hypothetical protein
MISIEPDHQDAQGNDSRNGPANCNPRNPRERGARSIWGALDRGVCLGSGEHRSRSSRRGQMGRPKRILPVELVSLGRIPRASLGRSEASDRGSLGGRACLPPGARGERSLCFFFGNSFDRLADDTWGDCFGLVFFCSYWLDWISYRYQQDNLPGTRQNRCSIWRRPRPTKSMGNRSQCNNVNANSSSIDCQRSDLKTTVEEII